MGIHFWILTAHPRLLSLLSGLRMFYLPFLKLLLTFRALEILLYFWEEAAGESFDITIGSFDIVAGFSVFFFHFAPPAEGAVILCRPMFIVSTVPILFDFEPFAFA